jgi:hypothetical protein
MDDLHRKTDNDGRMTGSMMMRTMKTGASFQELQTLYEIKRVVCKRQ